MPIENSALGVLKNSPKSLAEALVVQNWVTQFTSIWLETSIDCFLPLPEKVKRKSLLGPLIQNRWQEICVERLNDESCVQSTFCLTTLSAFWKGGKVYPTSQNVLSTQNLNVFRIVAKVHLKKDMVLHLIFCPKIPTFWAFLLKTSPWVQGLGSSPLCIRDWEKKPNLVLLLSAAAASLGKQDSRSAV